MTYQDVIRDSKFYLPMNLNLGYLLRDTEIVILMNVINCDNIHEKLSVRKLMRYTNRSNNTVQNALKTLRNLELIEGFTPNYDKLKYVFDSLNNAPSIEERIKWCEAYQKSIQKSVSETDTENVSKIGTQIRKMDNEDRKKEDMNISHDIIQDIYNGEKTTFETARDEMFKYMEDEIQGKNYVETLHLKSQIQTELKRHQKNLQFDDFKRLEKVVNLKFDKLSRLALATQMA